MMGLKILHWMSRNHRVAGACSSTRNPYSYLLLDELSSFDDLVELLEESGREASLR